MSVRVQPDDHVESDELDEFDFDAAARVGAKVIEMAERVQVASRIVPGARAAWCFSIEDVRFDVVVTVSADQEQGCD